MTTERVEPPGRIWVGRWRSRAAMNGDRRLADVDFVVMAAVALLAKGEATTRATDAEISASTAGRPSAKAVPRSLERLAGFGYILMGPEPNAATERLIVFPWRLR